MPLIEVSPGVFIFPWIRGAPGVQMQVNVEDLAGRVRLDVYAPDAPNGSTIAITRKHPSGKKFTCRAANGDPFSGAGVYYDHELPISGTTEPGDDRTCTYEATITLSDGVTAWGVSNQVSAEWITTDDWLKDPGYPNRDIRILIQAKPSTTFPFNTGVFDIQGRPEPLVNSDVRKSEVGTVTIVTLDASSREMIHLLTSTGRPLLIQTPPERGLGNLYIAPQNLDEDRVSPIGSEPARVFTLSYTEVQPPTGGIVTPGVTWATVIDLYDTWGDLIAAFPTWLDVIENIEEPTTIAGTLPWRGA